MVTERVWRSYQISCSWAEYSVELKKDIAQHYKVYNLAPTKNFSAKHSTTLEMRKHDVSSPTEYMWLVICQTCSSNSFFNIYLCNHHCHFIAKQFWLRCDLWIWQARLTVHATVKKASLFLCRQTSCATCRDESLLSSRNCALLVPEEVATPLKKHSWQLSACEHLE